MEGVRRVATSIPIAAMVVAGTLMLGNVSPTMVDPISEEIRVRRWMNRLMAPMRYAKETGNGGGGVEWARLTAADR